MLFFGKKKKKEEEEARALEKIMLEVLKAEENKENNLKKTITEKYRDFPIHKLLKILIRKNIIQ